MQWKIKRINTQKTSRQTNKETRQILIREKLEQNQYG